MLKKIRKHSRAFAVIPTGVLFAVLCTPVVAYAKGALSPEISQGELVTRQAKQYEVISSLEAVLESGESASSDFSSVRVHANTSPEDLVLAVVANKKKLSSGIFAIQQNGQYYLPFSALSDILGFYYEMDTSRFVEGWALSDKDDYMIDAQNNFLRFRGTKVELDSGSILAEGIASGDMYVRIDVLSQIWPLQLDVNLSSLVLKIIPDGKLPFEQAFERKLKRERAVLTRAAKTEEETFPFVPYPYQLLTKPVMDVSAVVGYDEVSKDAIGRANLNGVNDFLYASADYSLNLSQRGGQFQRPENIRFRLSRQNIHDGALPLGLEDAQLGDVRLRNRELISSNSGGRGFVFSTEEKQKTGEFDLVTIDGVGTPEWEVELYLNNELIEFGLIDERGEYRFEDISVGFGNNRFRIVLYGPQGQIEERIENYIYQSSMVKEGSTRFSGGILDANKDLIPVDERDRGRASGLTANMYGAYGIHEKLTGFATVNTVRDRAQGKEISREYVSVGGVGSIGSTLAQVEGYKQLDGGTAIDVRTLSDFFGFKVNSQISVFSNFESPDAKSGASAKELETELSVKRVFRTLMGSLGLELRRNYLKRETGSDTSKYVTRQSLGVKGVRMTNTTTSNFTDGDHSLTNGRFSTSTRHDDWNLRNTVNYSIHPDTKITAIQSELRYGRKEEYKTGLRASYDFQSDEARLGVQLSKDFKKFLGSAEAEWSSDKGVGFSLRASAAMGPYAKDGGYSYRSHALASIGPMAAVVYADENSDGVLNDGDTPVEDAKIILNRRSTREKTDEDGYLMEMTSISSGRMNVKVSKESIGDPYLVPSIKGYNVHPRAGVVQKLEFPLIETGAIDGTLRERIGGEPIAGVMLQLLDEQADLIQETKTGADGYYTFEQIPPGNYTIRPAPEDGLDIPFKYVNLTKDNLFQFGTDVLGERDDLAEPVDIGVDMKKDGTLSAKGILALAKGFKGKAHKNIHKASLSNNSSKIAKTSQKPNIKKVRIGEHPNKVRIVMDLSAPLEYSISFDPQSNSVFVDMPYAEMSAGAGSSDKVVGILNNYHTEKMDQGVRLILGVDHGVKIGASGLLEASGSNQDRLYIDIEKQ